MGVTFKTSVTTNCEKIELDKNIFLSTNSNVLFTGIAFPSCCTKTFQFLSEIPDKCAPIQVPDDDPFYSQFGVKCMSMPRTDTNRDNNCSLDNNQVEQVCMFYLLLCLKILTDRVSIHLF